MSLIEEINKTLNSDVDNYFDTQDMLEKARDELLKTQWIPVSPETMPEHDTKVLVCKRANAVRGKAVEAQKWWDSDQYDPNITHWMPLPESPNE